MNSSHFYFFTQLSNRVVDKKELIITRFVIQVAGNFVLHFCSVDLKIKKETVIGDVWIVFKGGEI